MPLYEYTFGVMVEAENREAAWEKVREISEQLDEIDNENQSSVDGPFERKD